MGPQKSSARSSSDLSIFPDMVVIYLGMRDQYVAGVSRRCSGWGRRSRALSGGQTRWWLLHENLLYSLRHVGMRQYWRDFESLEAWSRSEPHRTWWRQVPEG